MVKYVIGLQRHCLPTDVFFWTIFNTDAEGDRLVIKGANGNANVIGWPEIAVAFGAHHDPQGEFRSNKVMQSKLRDLQPELFLPQAVESNPNKKLVNGQRYEECLYYREAAPYGSPPTNLEQFRQLLGSEIADLVTGKYSSFWLHVQEQVSVASLWKGKHEGLLRANTELSSKMAEKDKDCLVKEAEWKKTMAALRDELASVRVADGLAIEGFQMQKQVLEGELKRLKNSSEPVVEGLKEKVAKLEEELSAKEWLQEQYNAIGLYTGEGRELAGGSG
ncbi:hypothetical protein R1sor_010077 [Riccia sorocarpa]|uniref:Uncharacterized protein n=1 Tax=Riccia sorocarpa TaxID=122646 RepID=A0ABD3HYF2_9MARC